MNGKKLSLFGFFALTASMLMSADEYPAFAESGMLAIFYLILAGVFWFLPVALCSAELATVEGWEEGGVFAWVTNTLGERCGFVAIFFQWFQITVNFITMIYFIIGALSYAVDIPFFNQNSLAKFALFLIIYWGMTFFQLGGINQTDGLVKFCFIIGIIVPSAILLILAILYVTGGHTIHFQTNIGKNIADFSHQASFVAIAPYILAFTGIEASASHINEMKKPSRDYPLTLLLLVLFAILLDSLGGLSVATVIPTNQLSMNQGVIQAVEKMVLTILPSGKFFVRIVAIMMALGMLGEISSWIIGPVKGLFVTAEVGILPQYFNNLNKRNVPTRLIIFQGIIVTLFGGGLTLFAGGNNMAFKMAMSLTVMLYLVTYLLIFIAYLQLSLKQKNRKRSFQITKNIYLKVFIGTTGFLGSLLVLGTTFLPSSTLTNISTKTYIFLMLVIFIVVIFLALGIYHFGKKEKQGKQKRKYHIRHIRSNEANPFIFPKARGEHHFDKIDKT